MPDPTDLIGPTVIALDAIINGPPDAPEWQALLTFRDLAPLGFRDQVQAAVTEMDQQITRGLAAGVYDEVHLMNATEHPDWLRLGALDTLAAWLVGAGATCVHAPHPSRPQPLIAAAWKPRLVVCRECIHLLVLPGGSKASRTCDACGSVVAGLNAGEPIYTSALQITVLRYGFGVCADCRYWPEPGT